MAALIINRKLTHKLNRVKPLKPRRWGRRKGESTACVASVRACGVTGAPEALAVTAVA